MPTHQALSGSTDEAFVQRMVQSYAERFGEAFWTFFDTHVASRLPSRPVMVDIGCGPGLFLQALSERYPKATLYGYDVTPAMIAHGEQLPYAGARPSFSLHDVAAQPLPLATGTVHLVTMTSVLHVFDDPFPALAEIHRVLVPTGRFMLHDWIRHTLQAYLSQRPVNNNDDPATHRWRGMRLFPVHNKYTVADWEWVLHEAEFAILRSLQLRPSHQMFVTIPTGS
ncbi:MAG: class I SAM-dependent methyltransferase [Candidatus Tectomicrobia bacterium]|uniref:Class I SAM-dependent methyltransferase n=1 Tax=Tectimicrobiota bacterium TaxID=2528274 RepID=A0A937VWT7_UNCTE|nr:class I SAM-dependent methyltransferase [Candidatus Tectomicrobia bacterium]